ncbi:MAG: voltage-gated potassium channel [Limisphaerales bacterium]|jgi:voltage-gated potassium channel
MSQLKPRKKNTLRFKLHEIIFEADTRLGKLFDVVLLVLIVLSVFFVMLESVESINIKFRRQFLRAEWVMTVFFTFEYIARLLSVRKPLTYAKSFFGIIDLLAILPSYLIFLFPDLDVHSLMTIRGLRLLRLFRIFKLVRYVAAYRVLLIAIKDARPKIVVFLIAVLSVVVFVGSLMYLVEGRDHGFENIPKSIYWAIVTVTTVGYGDIHPQTDLGRFFAAILMIVGYAIIAVPTGIVSAEMAMSNSDEKNTLNTQHCRNCSTDNHSDSALYCYKCGEDLHHL